MDTPPHAQERASHSAFRSGVFPATIAFDRDAPFRSATSEREGTHPAPAEHSSLERNGAGPRGLKLRRVLVTGANGFLGGHLVESLLKRNIEVRAAIRRSADRSHLDALDVDCISLDWSDDAALRRATEGVDCVVHLAAAVAAISSETLYQVNAGLTERLAQACASHLTPPAFVYCSTIAAAGPSLLGQLRIESQPPSPISDYGRSKRGGEIALEKLAGKLPATIVRPGIIFGERNRDMLPIFQTISMLRMHFVPSFHPPKLSFIYVGDACHLLIRAAERGARIPADADPNRFGQGIYNASCWEAPNYGQLGRMVGEALGQGSPLIIHLTEPLNWMIGWGGEIAARILGASSTVSRDKIREAIALNWASSPAKAERELGVVASAPLAVRLAEVGQWYREAGWL